MKKIRWILALLSVAIILIATILYTNANNTKLYELYKNDTKFSLPEYPAVSIDSEIYVPTSFFIGFDNVIYEYNKNHQSFYFVNTDTLRYFSFSFNSKDILVDGVYTQKNFPVINSAIYLPLSYCADILSLKLEIRESHNTVNIRLTDGRETLGFDELIERLNPVQSENPDIKNPDNPIDNPQIDTPIENDKEKVFLMFKFDSPELVKTTLDALTSFGERATVFLDNEQMLAVPEEVIHTLVSGNALGIIPGDNILSVSQANQTLKLITNTMTRAVLSDLNSETDGIVFLNPDINSESYTHLDSWAAAQSIYNDALGMESPYILINVHEDSQNLILALLGFFSNDKQTELKIITQ